ncbi:ATPase [Aureococcus anophagefferens]|nr:ATPase [Aureococcus anophagefferens]
MLAAAAPPRPRRRRRRRRQRRRRDATAAGGAAPPAPVATEVSSDAGVVSIGGVSLSVARDFDAALVPAPPPLRGCGFEFSREAAATLQWMLRKAALRQDMFLLGDAGPRCRQLALAFCELARREAEFVSLTRDSNESDLKQRRELRGGDLAWADQPPVAAAKRGRVLILEGVEKAERNVLPLLNNLLENREMALEDGTFLTPRANAGDARLARVHDDFLVVAIGRPAARYARRKDDDAVAPLAVPLDPPLRSRFVSRRGGLAPSEDAACLAALGVDDGPTRTRSPVLRRRARSRRVRGGGRRRRGAAVPEGGGLSVGALLVAFPGAPFYGFAGRAFPAAALALDKAAEKALRDLGGAVEAALRGGAARRDYALVGASKTSRRACRLVFRAGADEVVLETACGPGAVAPSRRRAAAPPTPARPRTTTASTR